jgi:molybdopterin/thiamine biosynthesis adenylyltransferase
MQTSSPPPKWKRVLNGTKHVADMINSFAVAIKLIISIAALFVVALFVNAQFTPNDTAAAYIAEAAAYKARADSAIVYAQQVEQRVFIKQEEAAIAMARADELSAQVQTLRTRTRVLTTRIDSIKQSVPPLTELDDRRLAEYANVIIPQQETVIAQQEEIIETQDNEIVDLRLTILAKTEIIGLLTQSNDSLVAVLTDVPVAPKNPNKVFGIKLPSRKASFVKGVVIGTVAAAVVLR